MRVLVCGSRNYIDRTHVWTTLQNMHAMKPITMLIHGGQSGVDRFAGQWAEQTPGVEVAEFLADWHKLGPGAGPKRNRDMITYGRPDIVVAFPGGSGTANMVEQAEAAGIKVKRIP